jgi:hypothetical protein
MLEKNNVNGRLLEVAKEQLPLLMWLEAQRFEA